MASRTPPIARIRLARSWPRLLGLPLLLLLVGVGMAAVGLVMVGGSVGLVLVAAGGLLGLAGTAVAAILASVRVEVEESAVRLRRIGGERVYLLTPGPVTRVRLHGANASRLRARSRLLGWGLGRARLRDEEDIEIVRLARTSTAILVPTERGRLAIAPANDDDLLDALSHAARARERLDELMPPAAAPRVEPEPTPVPVVEPHILTGIERALLEERLAEERRIAAEAATHAAAEAARAVTTAPVSEPLPQAEVIASPEVRRRQRAWARVPSLPLRRPRPSAAFVLVPLVGAGAAWGAGLLAGRMPEAGTDLARLTSLALVLSGPATSVGAIMARTWWPRLVGVVVAGGLIASAFIGRSLVGG